MKDFTGVLYSLIGSRIKTRRESRNLNQAELADKVEGIGRTSISNIESGRQFPPLHVIFRICTALDIDVHDILPTNSEILEIMKSEENSLQEFLMKSDLDENIKDTVQRIIQKT